MQTVVPTNQSQVGPGGQQQSIGATINSQRQPEDQIAISHQQQNPEPTSAQIKTPGNRIIQRDNINFHGQPGQNSRETTAQEKASTVVVQIPQPNNSNNFGISPTKKHANTTSKNDQSGPSTQINVTLPNPLLMLNGNIQIQYLQEIVRNVIQRVDDIFHLRQLIDIKNHKLKDKALAANDNESTSTFDEIKSKEV